MSTEFIPLEQYPLDNYFIDFPQSTEINWHDERIKNILIQHVVDKLDVEETLNRIQIISGVRTTKRILQQRSRRQRENLIKSRTLNEERTLISYVSKEQNSPESFDTSLESLETFDFNFDIDLPPELTSFETFADDFILSDFSSENFEDIELFFGIRQAKHTLLPITMRYPLKFDPLYTKELLTQFSEAVNLAFFHLNVEEAPVNEENQEFLTSGDHINFFVQFLVDMKIFYLIFNQESNLQDQKMNKVYNIIVQTAVNWIMQDTPHCRIPPLKYLPQTFMTRFQFRRLLVFIDSQMNFLTQLIENYLKLNPQFEEIVFKSKIFVCFIYSALGGIAQRLIDCSINKTLDTEGPSFNHPKNSV